MTISATSVVTISATLARLAKSPTSSTMANQAPRIISELRCNWKIYSRQISSEAETPSSLASHKTTRNDHWCVTPAACIIDASSGQPAIAVWTSLPSHRERGLLPPASRKQDGAPARARDDARCPPFSSFPAKCAPAAHRFACARARACCQDAAVSDLANAPARGCAIGQWAGGGRLPPRTSPTCPPPAGGRPWSRSRRAGGTFEHRRTG